MVYMKTKGLLAGLSVFALSLALISPVLAVTDPTAKSLTTGLTRESGGGNAPIVKAKWEMNTTLGSDNKYLGTDDAPAANAQFNPSGQYQVGKKIAVCGVVTDPDGLADINQVYADIFYPTNVALGPNHESGRQGCGQELPEFTLLKLSKADGIDLFCNKVRTTNTNLPTFNTVPTTFSYDEICKQDGELLKETAAVYCGETTLSYEDPSGQYRTLVLAQDKSGLDGKLENFLQYNALTVYETDFDKVSYGSVKLNTHKIINGDLKWDILDQGGSTIRNTGNTRLDMKVLQDDMGLGQTDGKWNVQFDGRIGSGASFVTYNPQTATTLPDTLNLSETDEMDFSVDIFKWPPTHTGDIYAGTMVLSASPHDHLTCTTTPTTPTS